MIKTFEEFVNEFVDTNKLIQLINKSHTLDSFLNLLVKKEQGRWGTYHYSTFDKPKGNYQLPGMNNNYIFDSKEDALEELKKRYKIKSFKDYYYQQQREIVKDLNESENKILDDFLNIKEYEFIMLYNIAKSWQRDFPDEEINWEYMIYEFDRHDLASIHNGSVFDFIYQKAKDNSFIINSFLNSKKEASKTMRGCYYNSLDYILRFKNDYKNIKLAWGFTVDKNQFEKWVDSCKLDVYKEKKIFRYNLEYTKHAFLIVDDKKIIDPTLGKPKDEYYFYETVPEEDYKDFKHKFNDKEFEARDFADKYIPKQMKKYKTDFNVEFPKFLKKNNLTI